MRQSIHDELLEHEVFLAGQQVQAGQYCELETGRTVELNLTDILPASLDGRVACYVRLPSTWGQLVAQCH